MSEHKLQYSTDLWYTAYLMSKGFKILSYDVIARGKGKFCFEMSDSEWHKNKLDFSNSDASKLKQIIESLKDMCY